MTRDTFAFSKKLANHIGAIKYFICHYNHQGCSIICITRPSRVRITDIRTVHGWPAILTMA